MAYADIALQLIVEYGAALAVALVVLYQVDPIFSGFLFGAIVWLTRSVSGSYISPVNTILIGTIHKRSVTEIALIVAAQFFAGVSVYMFYINGGLDYI